MASERRLEAVLQQSKGTGIEDGGVTWEPGTADQSNQSITQGGWPFRTTYILQTDPLGLAHAVKTARGYLADDPFLMYLGDNLIGQGIQGMVESTYSWIL